jgi:hypothetical protein
MAIRDAVLLASGAALGGLAACLFMMRQLRAARSRAAEQAERMIKLAHDIRGAVTPALLMTERLEQTDDPAVRRAAAIVAGAIERTSELAKAASADARASGRNQHQLGNT